QDVERWVRFYEALGWTKRGASIPGEIAWFGTADTYLGVFGWRDLAEDAQLYEPTRGSFGGMTLAINVESREVVDQALDEAVAAGGPLLEPPPQVEVGYRGHLAPPHPHPPGGASEPGLPPRRRRPPTARHA